MYDCKIYDDELRMVKDLQVQCYKSIHLIMSLAVGVPGFLLVGIGIPSAILYMMCRDWDRLDTVQIKEKFGFLFNGYKRPSFYWEIVIMFRKVFFVMIVVFLDRVGKIVQALVILMILVVFIQVNNLKRPFIVWSLNELENYSLTANLITVYCGVFFLSA